MRSGGTVIQATESQSIDITTGTIAARGTTTPKAVTGTDQSITIPKTRIDIAQSAGGTLVTRMAQRKDVTENTNTDVTVSMTRTNPRSNQILLPLRPS